MPIRKNIFGPALAILFLGTLIYIYHYKKKSPSEIQRINPLKTPKNEIIDTIINRPQTGEIEF